MTFGLSAGAIGLIGAVAPSVIGGVLGSDPTTTTQSSQKSLPSYLVPLVTGPNGLLSGASSLYQQQAANGGLNALQQQGIQSQLDYLRSPQYTAGYDQMRQQGMDLLGRPIAGNPFTSGNTGGMGGYGSLTAQGAGTQTAHPSANTSSFTPQLLGNVASAGSAYPTPQAPAQALPGTAQQNTISQIIAQLSAQPYNYADFIASNNANMV